MFLDTCDRSVAEFDAMSVVIEQLVHPSLPVVKLFEQLIKEKDETGWIYSLKYYEEICHNRD